MKRWFCIEGGAGWFGMRLGGRASWGGLDVECEKEKSEEGFSLRSGVSGGTVW